MLSEVRISHLPSKSRGRGDGGAGGGSTCSSRDLDIAGTIGAKSVTTETDEERLLASVPTDGSSIGITTLMRTLCWDEYRYWPVRDALIQDGGIERARGLGGSVRRVLTTVAPLPEPDSGTVPPADSDVLTYEHEETLYEHEAALYEPLRRVIQAGWAKDHQTEPLTVEITAARGRRSIGGRWTRPDIVSVAVKTYRYVPEKFIEVITFEVKPLGGIGVSAVYEALAHLRSATHAYVVFHLPDDQAPAYKAAVEETCKVARAHGVGVIIATSAEAGA